MEEYTLMADDTNLEMFTEISSGTLEECKESAKNLNSSIYSSWIIVVIEERGTTK